MCKMLTIWKESDDGEMFDDLGVFDTLDPDSEPPVLCGCWYGAEATEEELEVVADIAELHVWLIGKLKPYLRDPRFGRIVIEVH